MARPFSIDSWHIEAAHLMASTGCTLRQAAAELSIDITADECALLMRRAGFKQVLQTALHKFHRDLATDPNFSKDTTIGMLLALAQKLEVEGEHDKAAEVLFKIAKLSGWIGIEGQVNVFSDLTQKDLDSIRKSLQPHSQPTTKIQ